MTKRTIDEAREEAQAAREEAASTIERLGEERKRVTPEAISGEEAAYERLEEIERLTDEAQARRELAESALDELERREAAQREQAQQERTRELEARYDELARGRKRLLAEVEKALDALEKKARALLELDSEQRAVAEEMGRSRFVAPYDLILKKRILARLGVFLAGVPGAAAGRHEPLTEDTSFTRTIAEEERVARETKIRSRRNELLRARGSPRKRRIGSWPPNSGSLELA